MPEILESQIKALEKEILKSYSWVGRMLFRCDSNVTEVMIDERCEDIQSMEADLEKLRRQAKKETFLG